MKKSYKLLILIVVFCLFFVIGALSINYVRSYTLALKLNWGIELPNAGAKEIFSYSEPSFLGDGIRYHVIDYPNANKSKRNQKTLLQLEKIFLNSQKPSNDQIIYVEQLLQKINVKKEMIPNWEDCILIYQREIDHSELFLFYLSETGTVYIVESFQ